MDRLATLAFLLIAGVFISLNGQAQTKKGPAYKNASPGEKYQGHSKVLIKTNPFALKGPEAKNHKHPRHGDAVLTASLKDSNQVLTKSEYKVVDLNANESKFDKGLKGPEFKNYKPGKKGIKD